MLEGLLGISPAFALIVGGIICGLAPSHTVRKLVMIAAPILGFAMMASARFGDAAVSNGGNFVGGILNFGGNELITVQIDNLSFVWGVAFFLAALLNGIYALHERCKISDSMALIYAGAAVGAVLAGDLITLFIFWELAALSSVFIIWKGGKKSYAAGMRYLAIHILSGVMLLAGAVIYARSVGSFEFGALAQDGKHYQGVIGLDAPGGWLIFIAFGIKCAFPLLHNWLQDSYPKASVTGTVVLSAFTTKLAVYALARGFAGEEILIYIGAVMTAFPVFFAVIENDLRKVLSYSLNNQLGFMVVGIGVGTALSLNGTAAHAFAHIIYKGLLFMSMGAVLMRTGTAKASELGGLYKSMPITAVFCMIGAGAISAFPLLSGFVAKSLILSGLAYEAEALHNVSYWIVLGVLIFASAGVMEHSGIKIPYFTFFGHDSGRRVKEAPFNMLLAMGISAFFCIALAIPAFGGDTFGYKAFYNLLPFTYDYNPYTTGHVIEQMQLLLAAMFAFCMLMRFGLYPPEQKSVILDTDWTYRRAGFGAVKWAGAMWNRADYNFGRWRTKVLGGAGRKLENIFSPAGALSEAAPSGLASVLTGVMLLAVLLIVYFV